MSAARRIDLRRALGLALLRTAGARWLAAAAILALLLAIFWAAGTFTREAQRNETVSAAAAVFFSVLVAYIVPILAFISERTATALRELGPLLDGDHEQQARWREQVYRKPVPWLVTTLAIGIASGTVHNLLLFGSVARMRDVLTTSAPALAVALGTLLVWIVMTVAISALLDNALLLRQLGRRCRIDLLQTRGLRPFARVAVLSTLAIIGAAAVFPIMFIDDDLDPTAYVPGLLATVIPMLLLAGLPVWPLHRRIAAEKARWLADIDGRIAGLPAADPSRPETIDTLLPLLAFRREVALVSEWPFDPGVLARLGFYLIIPPLTWVGAALIENVVDALL